MKSLYKQKVESLLKNYSLTFKKIFKILSKYDDYEIADEYIYKLVFIFIKNERITLEYAICCVYTAYSLIGKEISYYYKVSGNVHKFNEICLNLLPKCNILRVYDVDYPENT